MLLLHFLAAAGFGPAVEFGAEEVVIGGFGDGWNVLCG
jgi:hypothetical protein